jgi:hypothetical protein
MNTKDISLSVKKAEGTRCNRCRKVVKEVKYFDYPNSMNEPLCFKCFDLTNTVVEENKSGWYKNTWVHFLSPLNIYNGCESCESKASDGGKYSILKSLGKGQEWKDFCSLNCVKQYVDKEKK